MKGKNNTNLFKTICLFLGIIIFFGSCIEREFDEIKEIPKTGDESIYNVIDRKDLAYYFGHQKSHNSKPTKIPTDISLFLLDSRYMSVDYFFFLKFNKWFSKLKFENGIMPINQNETLDCDNFAMLYKSLFSVSGYASKNSLEFAVGLVVVEQKNPFGGIPAGSLHMLNIIFSNRDFFILEPQTGEFIELHKYPNQEHIINIIL